MDKLHLFSYRDNVVIFLYYSNNISWPVTKILQKKTRKRFVKKKNKLLEKISNMSLSEKKGNKVMQIRPEQLVCIATINENRKVKKS